MNIADAVIIVVFIIGILNGFRNGMIKSVIGLVGIILVCILSFQLKNPVAEFFYKTLPFFDFKIFKGVAVFNILFYETISFVIIFSLLSIVLGIILKVTGIVQKILDATIILGIGSRLIGMVIGFLETYIIVFVVLLFLNQPFVHIPYLNESKVNHFILNNTLVLDKVVKKEISMVDELFDLKKIYENTNNINEYNYKSLDILLKYDIIKVSSVKVLLNKNKLNFDGINDLIIKYGG